MIGTTGNDDSNADESEGSNYGIEDVWSLGGVQEPLPTIKTKTTGGSRARPTPMRQQHREKLLTRRPLWAGMITKSLPRGDPRARSPEARSAVLAELKALRQERTWLENEVYELDEAKQLFPD